MTNNFGASFGANILNQGSQMLMGWLDNLMQGQINEQFQDRYMQRWGGIGAQFDQLKKQGVNPFAIAGQHISPTGSSGFSPTSGPQSELTGLLGTTLNPTVKANMESQTRANNENADNLNQDKKFKEQTLDARVAEMKNNKHLSDNAVTQSDLYTGKYDQILGLNIEQLQEGINKTKEDIKNLEKQRDEIQKNIEKMNEEITLIKDQDELQKSIKKLTDAQTVQQYFNNRIEEIKANNMRDFNIEGGTASEAYFIAGLNGDDKTIEGMNELHEKLSSAETTGRVTAEKENDPIARTQKSLTEEFEDEDKYLTAEIAKVKHELRMIEAGQIKDNYFGTKRAVAERHLKELEGRRNTNRDKYYESLRRYGSNKSTSIGVTSVSTSK